MIITIRHDEYSSVKDGESCLMKPCEKQTLNFSLVISCLLFPIASLDVMRSEASLMPYLKHHLHLLSEEINIESKK